MQIIIHQLTFLKQSTAQASTLPAATKRAIQPGSYEIVDLKPSAAGHWSIRFPDKLFADEDSASYFNWLIYNDDRVTLPHEVGKKLLKVQYASQLDNKAQPHRTCNTSCHWMLLNYLRPGARSSDDEYWRIDVAPYGDTTDHSVHTRAFARYGIASHWVTDLDFADIVEQIDLGIPVPIGILHRGPQAAPTGGHIILVVGYEDRGLRCHDPYGVIPYSDWRTGENVLYSYEMLSARWQPDGKDTGWGRLVSRR